MNTQIADRAVVIGASIAGLLAAHVLSRQLRPGDGDRPGRAARDADASTRRPPRPPPPRARRPRAASTGGTAPRAHRRTGRRRGPGRGPAGRRPLLPQRSPATTGAQRTDAPVRQPTTPGAPRPGQDANPPQPAVRRPLRRRRTGHLPRWSPRHRGAGAPSRRRQRRRSCCDADLVVDASGRGSRTPAWLEALGYPPPQQEQVRIGLGLRHPDLPAAGRRPSTATWRSSSRRRRSIRGPGPCSGSKATGGC